jgi:hypothetical protein
MPVAECARLILQGMERRQREVVMTRQGKLGRWVKLIAPGMVERMALAALQRPWQPLTLVSPGRLPHLPPRCRLAAIVFYMIHATPPASHSRKPSQHPPPGSSAGAICCRPAAACWMWPAAAAATCAGWPPMAMP